MRARPLAILVLWSALLTALIVAPRGAEAARHHFYVGTITKISATSLTIHSRAHNTNFSFTIVSSTQFLQHGQPIGRTRFRAGSYVTVSYSPGPHNSMIAYHISLRR